MQCNLPGEFYLPSIIYHFCSKMFCYAEMNIVYDNVSALWFCPEGNILTTTWLTIDNQHSKVQQEHAKPTLWLNVMIPWHFLQNRSALKSDIFVTPLLVQHFQLSVKSCISDVGNEISNHCCNLASAFSKKRGALYIPYSGNANFCHLYHMYTNDWLI